MRAVFHKSLEKMNIKNEHANTLPEEKRIGCFKKFIFYFPDSVLFLKVIVQTLLSGIPWKDYE